MQHLHTHSCCTTILLHITKSGCCFYCAEHNCESRKCKDRKQIRLPSHLWVLFLMLLISISPNPCRGACWTTHIQSHPHYTPCLFRPHTVTLSFNLSQCLKLNPTVLLLPHAHPQRSCRNPKWSSKAPLTHASSSRQKAIARTGHTGQSGSGTYQESPT